MDREVWSNGLLLEHRTIGPGGAEGARDDGLAPS